MLCVNNVHKVVESTMMQYCSPLCRSRIHLLRQTMGICGSDDIRVCGSGVCRFCVRPKEQCKYIRTTFIVVVKISDVISERLSVRIS